MIYTVTFNPAIDYVMHFKELISGEVNRSESEECSCGGKGINVSIILKRLGIENVALGFYAGFTGDALKESIEAEGVKTDMIQLKNGLTRINVKIKADSETELNSHGPEIGVQATGELIRKLERLKSGDILVLAGSVPSSMPDDIYEQILERLKDKGILFVVDATKNLLKNVLKYRPFLVKPNNFELGEMFGTELNSITDIEKYAKKVQEMGAVNVLVSMAGDGAILLDENGVFHRIGAARGKVINSVGAGDSMVAGFIAGYTSQDNYEYALKLGTAAGGATAFSLGLAQKDKINEVLNSLEYNTKRKEGNHEN